MEDDSRFGGVVKWGLGAVGLGAVAAVVVLPRPFGIWVGLAILILCLLIFGGYFLWRRMRAKRQSRAFSSAIEAQTAAAPKAISDPNQRAALDKLRQKFQTGLQEFKSRGKDIYKLPWYVIIGESGSGKTEAIRHSGIEFPPGLQDELQGSGGTVNMDWWFTNRGIILDTAGSMIFRETQAGSAPEWAEFLRLLKKARPHCPVNGLFLVLSIESLIKDSADKIAEKASRLAQQLDLIQRTLDVRFPVYLIITKADLLTGFREFFDNIEDPLLQHQMFGWSNPDPLDSHFRPDLVEQHLKSVADRLRRRRLALLLRESAPASPRMGETTFFTASAVKGQRRLDETDSLFALPESVMRLVPRLRRYLETVFVAGEWSAKPVFLRGIYFTSSMREGKALDEAIALATGLSVDQLPEDRTWEKNRAFFLRDLFVEKVFRESGLVTRATNTIQLLRKRQFAIFGTVGVALLLLIVLAAFGKRTLKKEVADEAAIWEAGANGWQQDQWAYPIVSSASNAPATYRGNHRDIPVGANRLSLVEFETRLQAVAARKLSVGWVFKPLTWFGLGGVTKREEAQRVLFENGVLMPLVDGARGKMGQNLPPDKVGRHQSALLTLIQLQADAAVRGDTAITTNEATTYLTTLLRYVLDDNTVMTDTNLVNALVWTYSDAGSGRKAWPPEVVVGRENDDLAPRRAIQEGLESLRRANAEAEKSLAGKLAALDKLTDAFSKYRLAEEFLFKSPDKLCGDGFDRLEAAREAIKSNQGNLRTVAGNLGTPLTNLAGCYDELARQAAGALEIEAKLIPLPAAFKRTSLFGQITNQLATFRSRAADPILKAKQSRNEELSVLDEKYVRPWSKPEEPAYELRWSFYRSSCLLAKGKVDEKVIGRLGESFSNLVANAQNISDRLATYQGPLAKEASTICYQAIGRDVETPKLRFVESYARFASNRLAHLKFPLRLNAAETYTPTELSALRNGFLNGLAVDLHNPIWQSFPPAAQVLAPLRSSKLMLVAAGLTSSNGAPAEMEIVFTPPLAEGQRIALRYLKVFVDGKEFSLTGGTRPGDLSSFNKEPTPIAANISMASGVRFEFFSNVDRTSESAAYGEANWLLPRLIAKDRAEPAPGRDTEWQLKLPVTIKVGGQANPGTVEAFSLRLKHPLPPKTEWPK